MAVTYQRAATLTQQDLKSLYDAVGWSAYTKEPERLQAAVAASLDVVTAWDAGRLVGLARVVGDGLTVVYLQDILVVPDYQRSGVGRELFRRIFEPYTEVRQKLLMTDDEERQAAFYQSMGFTNIAEMGTPLRVFARFD